MNNEQTAIRTTYFSIIGNTTLALIKGLAGFLGNSYALIADAIESTTDIFASLLVLLGFKYAKRPADENHPYGHGKIEPLITFGVVTFLVVSATIIAYESIQNIQTPHKIPKSWTLIVLGLIIVWKEISFQIVIRKSKQTNSSSLKADAWHHRSDAITSVMAFIGISIAIIFGNGYETADDWAALFASAFILYNSYLILRPALGEVMDEQLYDDLILELGERSDQVSISKSILADVFESIIAAIYITKGYANAFMFVSEVFEKQVDFKKLVNQVDNFKSALLEFTQAEKMSLPSYRVVTESGPGHDKIFEIMVIVDGKELGTGQGKSKKSAEQEAAKVALKTLGVR